MFGSAGEMASNANFVESDSSSKYLDIEFTKNRDFLAPDLVQQDMELSPNSSRYLMDSVLDNSNIGDKSDDFLSAILNGHGHDIDLNRKCQFEAMVESYCVGLESQSEMRMNNGNSDSESSLAGQISSPPEFFNGICVSEDLGKYRIQRANSVNYSYASVPNALESKVEKESSLMKRSHDGDLKMLSFLNGFHNQLGDEMGSIRHSKSEREDDEDERFLQLQQEVFPCQLRAKRGCATHPRSLAERARRAKINEKLKKLQELFPYIEKHKSIADMLDVAAQHIKDLESQIQVMNSSDLIIIWLRFEQLAILFLSIVPFGDEG